MTKIRLARAGAKRRPFYHVVVTDSRNPRDGRNIESLGFYNPVAAGAEVPLHLEIDKIKAWIGKGAQLSDKVAYLVKQYERSVAATAA